MSDLERYSASDALAWHGGTRRPPMGERRIMRQLDSNSAVARRQLELNGEMARAADTEQTRRKGNQIDLTGALTVHTMQRVVDVIQASQDLAQGDPATELLLTPFRNTGLRKMNTIQNSLFNEWD